MMHPETTVKLSGQTEAVGAVAAMLGFHPTDSAVVLCLTGQRRRLGPVIRVDLVHGQIPAGLAAHLAQHAAQYADEAVVITFTDPEADLCPDTTALIAALSRVCRVLDVVDASNTPHPVPEQLLAANVLHGRAVLPDRAALARSVEHTPTTHPADPAILAAMGTVPGRDQWLINHAADPAAVPALVAAAQATRTGDPAIPNMCAALALLAYRRGDGALAQVAVDRALTGDPHHRMSHLMLAVMAAGLPPEDLDDLLTP